MGFLWCLMFFVFPMLFCFFYVFFLWDFPGFFKPLRFSVNSLGWSFDLFAWFVLFLTNQRDSQGDVVCVFSRLPEQIQVGFKWGPLLYSRQDLGCTMLYSLTLAASAYNDQTCLWSVQLREMEPSNTKTMANTQHFYWACNVFIYGNYQEEHTNAERIAKHAPQLQWSIRVSRRFFLPFFMGIWVENLLENHQEDFHLLHQTISTKRTVSKDKHVLTRKWEVQKYDIYIWI